MESRRGFIIKSSIAAGALTLLPSMKLLAADNEEKKLTILHTNDQHSRIEPFEKSKNERLSDKGGFARRAAVIEKIRQQEKNILLLDAGDVFQGTPYFNMYGGELEFKLMSLMGYDAGTIGNHEFDNGLEGLKKQLPHAKFDILSSNYDFSNTVLEGSFKPYKIFDKDGLKIGVFALGIELQGLVSRKSYQETVYLDPVETAQDMTRLLREKEKCNLVICLSHLGYTYNDNKVSDRVLASTTSGIDLIIGGHTHTFLEMPEKHTNAKGETVLVNQVGWAGLYLGRIDFYFKEGKVRNVALHSLNDLLIC